jgi:hypothetical protein
VFRTRPSGSPLHPQTTAWHSTLPARSQNLASPSPNGFRKPAHRRAAWLCVRVPVCPSGRLLQGNAPLSRSMLVASALLRVRAAPMRFLAPEWPPGNRRLKDNRPLCEERAIRSRKNLKRPATLPLSGVVSPLTVLPLAYPPEAIQSATTAWIPRRNPGGLIEYIEYEHLSKSTMKTETPVAPQGRWPGSCLLEVNHQGRSRWRARFL